MAEELLCLCCCCSLSFVFGSHWDVFRVYSWLCGTGLFLAALRFGRSGIKLGLAVCQKSSPYYLLPPALSLWSQSTCMREASASRLSTTNPQTQNQITTLTYTYLHSHFSPSHPHHIHTHTTHHPQSNPTGKFSFTILPSIRTTKKAWSNHLPLYCTSVTPAIPLPPTQ